MSGFGGKRSGGPQKVTYDVFVGNLPGDSNESSIGRVFCHYGEIQSIFTKDSNRDDGTKIAVARVFGQFGDIYEVVCRKTTDGMSKHAFVRFLTENDARKAMTEGNGMTLDGRRLQVKQTQKRDQRGGGDERNQFQRGGGDGDRNQFQRNGGFDDRNQSQRSGDGDRAFQSGGGDGDKNQHFGARRGGFSSNNQDVSNEQSTPPKPIREEQIIVTHTEDPCTFWGQVLSPEKATELMEVSKNIEKICPQAGPVVGPLDNNKIYASIFSEDGSWYRCQVQGAVSDNQSKIIYVDYGNGEVVYNSTIVELPSNLSSIPAFAQKYCFHGLRVANPSASKEEMQQALDQLRLLTDSVVLTAKVYPTQDDAIPVDLFHNESNINEEMVHLGHVVKVTNALKGPRNLQNSNRPGVDTTQRAKFPDRNTGTGGGYGGRSSGFGPRGDSAVDVNTNRTPDVQVETLRAEMERMKHDHDASVLELAAARGRVLALQNEIAVYQGRLQESNITTKVKNLVAGVSRVKTLRLQFPTDDQTRDVIQAAIDLVLKSDIKISTDKMVEIENVRQKLDKYNTCQDQIRDCKNVSFLPDLISVRDTARIAISEQLKQFLEVVSRMPVKKRADELNDILSNLLSIYSSFMRSDIKCDVSLVEAVQKYEQWRNDKTAKFQDVRTRTNTCHNALNSALRMLQQKLSLNLQGSEEMSCSAFNPDLDALLTKFQSAIVAEINESDIESGPDISVIAVLLKTLRDEMESELADIGLLQTMQIECADTQTQLEKWLTTKPTVANLIDIRKIIKGLKSRLRHRLADKQDLEESDDSASEELTNINQELMDIRQMLHGAFLKEDQYLAELGNLCTNHFPELHLQYPDFGINTAVEYEGLIKLGRDLNQYGVQPWFGKSTLQKGTYNGHAIVLKEYFLDENMDVDSREQMFQKMVKYYKIDCPTLLPLEGLFCHKNGRQIYAQFPFCTLTLKSVMVMQKEMMTTLAIYNIVTGVVRGLQALHGAGLVHAAIHPDNVFVGHDGKGILGDFDFLKTDAQRSKIVHSTGKGLTYTPPQGEEPSSGFDIYAVGILMLALHFPDMYFVMGPDGTPDLSRIRTKTTHQVMAVLMHVLNASPTKRLSANDLLKLAYFTEPPPKPQIEKCEEQNVTHNGILQLTPRSPSPGATNGCIKGILKYGGSGQSSPTMETENVKKTDTDSTDQDTSANTLDEGVAKVIVADSIGIVTPPISPTQNSNQEKTENVGTQKNVEADLVSASVPVLENTTETTEDDYEDTSLSDMRKMVDEAARQELEEMDLDQNFTDEVPPIKPDESLCVESVPLPNDEDEPEELTEDSAAASTNEAVNVDVLQDPAENDHATISTADLLSLENPTPPNLITPLKSASRVMSSDSPVGRLMSVLNASGDHSKKESE